MKKLLLATTAAAFAAGGAQAGGHIPEDLDRLPPRRRDLEDLAPPRALRENPRHPPLLGDPDGEGHLGVDDAAEVAGLENGDLGGDGHDRAGSGAGVRYPGAPVRALCRTPG